MPTPSAWLASDSGDAMGAPTSRSSTPSRVLDVGEVQADGRLVEHVDAALLGQAGGQLAGHHRQAGVDDAGAVAVGQAPSEFALNSAGFTPLAFANTSMVRVLVTREHLVPTDDPP